VLVDIGLAVFEGRPIDLRMGLVNVIWQGDANSICLRSLAHCQSPPMILNVTGPETVSVRYLAGEFGSRFGKEPILLGEESPAALLNNAAKAHRLFGYPRVTLQEMISATESWIRTGGPLLAKPTHFEVRDGKF
jgi:nucleoside-diphosphate-sugar epimerase